MNMKKVSVLTLSLVLALESVVFARPTRTKNTRRAAKVGTVQKTAEVATQTTDTTDTAPVTETSANVATDLPPAENNSIDPQILSDLNAKVGAAQSACSGIKSSLDTIFGLTVATTVSSGLGTAAAGAALATGIMKSKTDKEIEELENLSSLELYQQAVSVEGKMKEKSELEKKSKTLGNVRTGLMVGASVTSAASTGLSIGATLSAGELADKMEACNSALAELRSAKATAEAEGVAATDLAKAQGITDACTGYDRDNIKTLKSHMTASAIVSGVGTATGIAGTVTSIMANSDSTRAAAATSDDGKKKEKNLNTASNILAGVTAGTSLASTALSATAIGKAKKDSEMAEKCESAL